MNLRSFLDWLQNKGRLQIFSVILALIAWFAVHSGQTIRQRTEFPIQYVNIPPQLSFSSEAISKIQVTLTGTLHRLRSLDPKEIPYIVDLSNYSAGRYYVDIDPSNLKLPFDVRAIAVSPRRLELVFDELMKKEVPVKVTLDGVVKPGFVLTNLEMSPDPIQIQGPKSVVEGIEDLQLKLNIEGKSESFSTSLPVEWSDSQIHSVDTVLVEAKISKTNVEQKFDHVEVVAEGADAKKISINPAFASVIIRGPESALIDAKDKIQIFVSVQGLEKGRYRLRGDLKVSPEVSIVSMSPESFIVEVE